MKRLFYKLRCKLGWHIWTYAVLHSARCCLLCGKRQSWGERDKGVGMWID